MLPVSYIIIFTNFIPYSYEKNYESQVSNVKCPFAGLLNEIDSPDEFLSELIQSLP